MNQYLIWFAVAYFVISAIGGVISRQQKQARDSRGRERAGGRPPRAERDPLGSMPIDPRAEPEPRPHRQTPEEIAAEIRRVMGLERAESRVEVIEEVYEEPVVSAPSHMLEPPVEPRDKS